MFEYATRNTVKYKNQVRLSFDFKLGTQNLEHCVYLAKLDTVETRDLINKSKFCDCKILLQFLE